MLRKIRCNSITRSGVTRASLWCSTWAVCVSACGLHQGALVTRGALVSHQYTYAPLRYRTFQYLRTFIPLSVFLWNDLGETVFEGVGLRVSRAVPMPFYWPSCSLPFCFLQFSFFLLLIYGLVLWIFGLI